MIRQFLAQILAALVFLAGSAFAPAAETAKVVDEKGQEIPINGWKILRTDTTESPLSDSLKPPTPAPNPAPATTVYPEFLAVLGALVKLVVLAMLLERALAFLFEWRLIRIILPKDDELAARVAAGESLNEYEKQVQKGQPYDWVPSTVRGLVSALTALLICIQCKFNVFLALFPESQKNDSSDPLGIFLTSLILAGGSSAAIALFQGVLGFAKDSRDGMIEAKSITSKAAVADAKAKLAGAEQQKAEAEKAGALSDLEKANAERLLEQKRKPDAPTVIATAKGGGKVLLTLDATGATTYIIFSQPPGAPTFTEVARDVPGKSQELSNLALGIHQFKAIGQNSHGIGPESVVVSVTVT